MNLAAMRHRVGIGVIVRNRDDYGGASRADEVKDIVRASINPASEKEVFQYQQLQQIVTHKVEMRYHSDVKQGITLFFDNEQMYVISVTNPDRQKRFLRVMCRAGGAQ